MCDNVRIRTAARRWNLTDVETVYEEHGKTVCFALSAEYGPVVLKTSMDSGLLHGEYEALKAFGGNHFCRAYDYDMAGNILLEERLMPGTVLRDISDTNRRLEIFSKIFREPHPQAIPGYPFYTDWLERAWRFCRDAGAASAVTEKMRRAYEIGEELFEKYRERVLLHGDLHHDNILLCGKGTYKVIDPKGVIGPAIFDLPRFIMNELDTDAEKSGAEHIRDVIERLSRALEYERADVGKLYFMEVILGNVWCLQDGEDANRQEMDIASEILAVSESS